MRFDFTKKRNASCRHLSEYFLDGINNYKILRSIIAIIIVRNKLVHVGYFLKVQFATSHAMIQNMLNSYQGY